MGILLVPLVAVGVINPGGATLLGWSNDGTSLVWTASDTAVSFPKTYHLEKDGELVAVKDPSKLSAKDREKLVEDDPAMAMGQADPQIDETIKLAVVHDARTGVESKFILDYKAVSKEGKAKGELKKKYAGSADKKAFDDWKKAHPIVMTAGTKGATGTASITVAIDGDDAEKPVTKKSSTSWSVSNSAKVTLATACGKDKQSEVLEQSMDAMFTPSWTATPYWEPSGHRVLFVLQEAVAKTMRGDAGGDVQYVVVPCGPRVQVVATKDVEAATGKIVEAVEKAGPTVVEVGAAKQARAATVIYATDAYKDAAQKLAAAIPGGATVDKLTWKPKADIVVAVGASAK